MTSIGTIAAQKFVAALAAKRFENVFNPYSDRCQLHDLDAAVEIRQRNLELVLTSAFDNGVDSVWIARDLGYRGGRRTGLPLTDEMHLSDQARILEIPGLRQATIGPPVAERTAKVIWDMLKTINQRIFLWNVFPFHPHNPNLHMSNRRHTKGEREASQQQLVWLLGGLNPKTVVTIGRDAAHALEKLNIENYQVRHPSYGGQSEFREEMGKIYGKQVDESNLL